MNNCHNCGAIMIQGIFPGSTGWCSAECDISIPAEISAVTGEEYIFTLWDSGIWEIKGDYFIRGSMEGYTNREKSVKEALDKIKLTSCVGTQYVVAVPKDNNRCFGVHLEPEPVTLPYVSRVRFEQGAKIPTKWLKEKHTI